MNWDKYTNKEDVGYAHKKDIRYPTKAAESSKAIPRVATKITINHF